MSEDETAEISDKDHPDAAPSYKLYFLFRCCFGFSFQVPKTSLHSVTRVGAKLHGFPKCGHLHSVLWSLLLASHDLVAKMVGMPLFRYH